MSLPRLELLVGYEATLACLLAELEALGPGDAAWLNVYLIEPGESSQQVCRALEAACGRGARLRVSLDASWASAVQRAWEWTRTLRAELLALGRRLGEGLRVEARRGYDHSKFVLLEPAAGPARLLLGGINLGDRFRPWHDFMLRLEGEAVGPALERALSGAPPPPELPAPAGSWALVANAPEQGRFAVRDTLAALVAAPTLPRLRLAMAYLDRAGVAALRPALARGARLELLLPRRANVYHDANMRAAGELLRLGGDLELRLHPGMVHAKLTLAWGQAGEPTAFLGSANLKRHSLGLFRELNALLGACPVTAELEAHLAGLWDQAEPLRTPPRYFGAKAAVEDWLG